MDGFSTMHFTLEAYINMQEEIENLKLSQSQKNKLITRLIKENQNLEHQLKKTNNELSRVYTELEEMK